jgi:hypothetical protein
VPALRGATTRVIKLPAAVLSSPSLASLLSCTMGSSQSVMVPPRTPPRRAQLTAQTLAALDPIDPRSPTMGVERTPIDPMHRAGLLRTGVPRTAPALDLLDPRSPAIDRTPLRTVMCGPQRAADAEWSPFVAAMTESFAAATMTVSERAELEQLVSTSPSYKRAAAYTASDDSLAATASKKLAVESSVAELSPRPTGKENIHPNAGMVDASPSGCDGEVEAGPSGMLADETVCSSTGPTTPQHVHALPRIMPSTPGSTASLSAVAAAAEVKHRAPELAHVDRENTMAVFTRAEKIHGDTPRGPLRMPVLSKAQAHRIANGRGESDALKPLLEISRNTPSAKAYRSPGGESVRSSYSISGSPSVRPVVASYAAVRSPARRMMR